jgi:hypothetical protein
MSKVESLMGSGTLQPAKSGLFGAKLFEAKYQFQLTTETEGGAGTINGFVRVDEKHKLSPGASYLLELDDQRKCKLTAGRSVAHVKGIITYSVSGETIK